MSATPITISIVDDHKLFRQGIIQLLQSFPQFRVLSEAESVDQLLGQLEQEAPDVLLMDLEMPGMDGIDGCRLILERHPQQKIIALSMHSGERFIFQMMKLGARSYLPKDIDQEHLRQAVETVAASGFYFTDAITQAMLRGVQTNARQKPKFNSVVNPLSGREKEVLALLCNGLTASDIAGRLYLSVRTVEGHRQNLLLKTGTSNSVSLAVYAVKNGLLE